MGVKPLLFSHISNIFAIHIIEDRGEVYRLVTFYKLLLSDIKVKVLISS